DPRDRLFARRARLRRRILHIENVAGRRRELDRHLAQFHQDRQVDLLLDIRVGVEVGARDDVDRFELQRRVAVSEKVAPIEAHVRLGLDDLADGGRDDGQRLRRRVVADAELKYGTPLTHAPEVAYPRFENVGIRHDDLLAREAAQPRALDADVLDRALEVIDAEEVPDGERLVERDR